MPVRALSDAGVLASWEDAAAARTAVRPARMLAPALEGSPEDVERWPVGQRDAALLDLHAATFSPTLTAVAACPKCDDELEVVLDVADVRAPHATGDDRHELRIDERTVVYRLPTTADLAAIVSEPDPRAALATRCVTAVRGRRGGVTALPDGWVDAMSEAMAERDPQAELDLALTCPSCRHGWTSVLDVGDFVWRTLERRAQQLLADVATLAAAFGWSEDDVLALSPARRRFYLEMVDT